MAKKPGKGDVHNNVKKVLDKLRVDEDSDEKDFRQNLHHVNYGQNYKNKNQTEKMMNKK